MSVHPDPVVIVAARRTPIGAFQGALAHYSAPQLGAHALAAAVRQAGLQPDAAQEALMGCCLFAGLGRSAGPPGRARRRAAYRRAGHHPEQDVRLGHEGRHAGA